MYVWCVVVRVIKSKLLEKKEIPTICEEILDDVCPLKKNL